MAAWCEDALTRARTLAGQFYLPYFPTQLAPPVVVGVRLIFLEKIVGVWERGTYRAILTFMLDFWWLLLFFDGRVSIKNGAILCCFCFFDTSSIASENVSFFWWFLFWKIVDKETSRIFLWTGLHIQTCDFFSCSFLFVQRYVKCDNNSSFSNQSWRVPKYSRFWFSMENIIILSICNFW